LKSRLTQFPTTSSSNPLKEKEKSQDINLTLDNGIIANLSPDARKEINQLLHDRNHTATKRYGWRLAALTPYPSSQSKTSSKSKSKLSIRTQKKEIAERYLVILRGGPKSVEDTSSQVLLGVKEDLPERHSNPWALRERDRERIVRDEKIKLEYEPRRYTTRPRSPSPVAVARDRFGTILNRERIVRTDNMVHDIGYNVKGILRTPWERSRSPHMKRPEDIMHALEKRRKAEQELKNDSEAGISRRRRVESEAANGREIAATFRSPSRVEGRRISYSAAYSEQERESIRALSPVQWRDRIVVVDSAPPIPARAATRRPVIVDERPIFHGQARLDEEVERESLLRERERQREEILRKPEGGDHEYPDSDNGSLNDSPLLDPSIPLRNKALDSRLNQEEQPTLSYGKVGKSVEKTRGEESRFGFTQDEPEFTDERAREIIHGRLVQGHVIPDDYPSPTQSESGERPNTGDYSGQGYASWWEDLPRHHHPTRLEDVLEEDNRSLQEEPAVGYEGAEYDDRKWTMSSNGKERSIEVERERKPYVARAGSGTVYRPTGLPDALGKNEHAGAGVSGGLSGARRVVTQGNTGAVTEVEYRKRLEEDLRKSGFDERQVEVVLKKDKVIDANRPTYTRMSRKHLSLEILNRYRIDYELDQVRTHLQTNCVWETSN
jgi:hypothetical protein